MAFRKFIYSTTEAALNNAITAKTVTNDDIAFVNENGVMFIQTQGVKFPCGYSKAEADNRYLKLTGGTLTGHVYFDDASVVFIGDGTRSSLELESTSGMNITGSGCSITTDAGIDGGFSGYWNDGTASSNNNIPIASFNIDWSGYNIRGRDGSGSSAKNVARATHDSYGALVGKTDDPSGTVLEDYGFGFFADSPSSDSFVGLTPTGVKLYGGSSSKILVSDGTMSTLKTINNTSLLGSGNISVLTSHQDISGKQDKSTAVTHIANAAVGSATQPVYVNASGQAYATTYQLNATVPSGAKFTDTTYSAATTSTAGLMSAADKVKLNGIATGAQVNAVTGVKGNAESSYRTGNINITPANIGAIASSEKGAKSGVVPLNASGVIDSTYIPSLSNCVQSVSTTGSGNAVTAVTKSGSAITVTKGTTFVKSAATSGTGNAVTGYSLSSGTLTLTKGTTFVPYSDVIIGSTVTAGTFGKIPKIGTDGVMEVGRYMDFHHSNTTSTDYNVRIQTQNDTSKASVYLPVNSGTLALTSQIETQNNVDRIEFNNYAGIWASSNKTYADITINNNCIVDMDGWIYAPYIELGDKSTDGDVKIWYNGSQYSLNMQKAIQLGLFT